MSETIERGEMSESWQAWVGRTVDGRFPLRSYLGGSDHSAVFLTLAHGGVGDAKKAAIKLIRAEAADAEQQLLRWKTARELTLPNLIRIFEGGRCELEGTALLYVVQEYAEETLSQILPERALTAEEARGMLPPVLRALQCVHDMGLAHGRIQPSNILAVADQVKLSSDALVAAGERRRGARATSVYDPPEAATDAVSMAADGWQLGMTLVEALTQRLPVWDRARPSVPEVPATVPEPFREIAKRCLQVDPGEAMDDCGDQRSLGRGAALPANRSESAELGSAELGPAESICKMALRSGVGGGACVCLFLDGETETAGPSGGSTIDANSAPCFRGELTVRAGPDTAEAKAEAPCAESCKGRRCQGRRGDARGGRRGKNVYQHWF